MPHEGFHRLLETASAKKNGYFVFTSNVDGQFQKAGLSETRIVECHGSIHHFQCTQACRDIWDADGEVITVDEGEFRATEPLPKCRFCSALARPNILMFEDWSWREHRMRQQQERFTVWLDELAQSSAKLAVIELVAGNAIPTVRRTSDKVTDRFGGRLIRLNPRESNVPPGQIGLPLGAVDGICNIIPPKLDQGQQL